MRVGVVLMTYGSPKAFSDIPDYLKNVRGGRDPDESLVAEFRRRYELIGGSPLTRITEQQAAALERELDLSHPEREHKVVAGMRFAPPFVADVVPSAADGADALVGIVMSPQFSPIIMGGYVDAVKGAVSGLSGRRPALFVAGAWHLEPHFIQALSESVTLGLRGFDPAVRDDVQVLMTAHSMPKRVVQDEVHYIRQLTETGSAVASAANLADEQWGFCYQSAGHTPEEWLKPDFADIMPALAAAGRRHVLASPVQFLADHLETLYDIDIAARKQAEDEGIEFRRAPALNASPLFIRALAAVVERTISEPPLLPS